MSTRRWVLAPTITAGFGLALVLLLAAGSSGYQAQTHVTAISAAIQRERKVLADSQLVLTRLIDAEAGQRGYLLTGVEGYLAPYEEAARTLPDDLRDLVSLVSESPEQRRRLAVLEPAVAAKLEALRRAIEIRRRGGAEAARFAVLADPRAESMNLIRSTIEEIQREERSTLDGDRAASRDRRSLTRASIVAETSLGAMLLAVALFALNQQARQRLAVEREKERLLRAEAAHAEAAKTYEERARTAETLRLSEEEFRASFVLGPLGRAQVDPSGRFLRVNPQLCAMTGYPEAEILGKTWLDLTVPEDRDDLAASLLPASNGQIARHSLEKRCVRKDGSRIWAQIDTAVVRDAEGSVLHTIAAIQDVTDRTKVEEEREALLRLTEESLAKAERAADRVRRLVDSNILGVFFACGALVLEANDAFLDMIGYSRTDLEAGRVRWPELELLLPRDGPTLEALAQQTKPTPYEKELLHKDGTRVPILLGAARMGESAPEWVCFVVDLTERNRTLAALRAAQAQAEASNQAKDEFLSVLSHELRSPLHAMLGWLSILKKGLVAGRGVDRAIETLQRNLQLQVQLVNDLLDVSRMVSDKLAIEEQAVDLARVVHLSVESARPAAEAKGIALACSVAAPPGPVLGDEQRLLQVLGNLLTNAVKFTPSRGQVTVTLACGTDEATVTVTDTGAGIAPDFLPHVFDRFRQADASNTRTQGGLGIGLAIVKTLVELHGGRVEARSGGLGEGSSFTVHVPLWGGLVALPATLDASGDTPNPLAGMTLLVLDDDVDGRDALSVALQHAGARVLACGSAREARLLTDTTPPDVVVSDVGMPEENGYEFIRWLRARAAEYVPAIAVTGFTSAQDREEAARVGFDEHLAKPVDADELIAKLQLLQRGSRRPRSGVLARTVRRSG